MPKPCTYSNRRTLLQRDRDASPPPTSASSSQPNYPAPYLGFPFSSLETWPSFTGTSKPESITDHYYQEDPMLGYPLMFDQYHSYGLPMSTSEPTPVKFSIQATGKTMWPSPKTDVDDHASASPRTPPRDQSPGSVYQNQVLLPPSSGIIPASDNTILDIASNGPLTSLTTTTLTDLYYCYNKGPAPGIITSDYPTYGSDLSLLFVAANADHANPAPDTADPSPSTHVLSDIEWCFSGEDEDEDASQSAEEDSATVDTTTASPSPKTTTTGGWLSFQQEFEDEADDQDQSSDGESMISQDDDEPLVVKTHPLNLLLVDLREQMARFSTAIPEDRWQAIHRKVMAVLDKKIDGGEPAIRKCVLECVETLAKRIVWPQHPGWSEDDDDDDCRPISMKERHSDQRRRQRSTARPPAVNEINDVDDKEGAAYSRDEDEDDLLGYTESEYDDDFRLRPSRPHSASSSNRRSGSIRVFSSPSSPSKKTRQNYSRETTRILMNWYLQHGGKSPEPIYKEILAKKANKSLVQVSTWFQNARRRHHHKLIQYQRLSKQYPAKVHDYDSFLAFTEEARSSPKDTTAKKRSWDDIAEALHEAGPRSPKRK